MMQAGIICIFYSLIYIFFILLLWLFMNYNFKCRYAEISLSALIFFSSVRNVTCTSVIRASWGSIWDRSTARSPTPRSATRFWPTRTSLDPPCCKLAEGHGQHHRHRSFMLTLKIQTFRLKIDGSMKQYCKEFKEVECCIRGQLD